MGRIRASASAEGCRPGLPDIGWHGTGQRVMEMDEQSSDRQQPGIWESWTAASANPSSEPTAGEAQQASFLGQSSEPSQPSDPGQSSDPWQPSQPAQAGQFSAPDTTGQLPAFTQPIGYPQASSPAPGYGQPGYGQPGYGQPGYGQPG